MIRALISVFFIFFLRNTAAQSVDAKIDRKIDSLRSIGIETFLVYHLNCVGNIFPYNDKCVVTQSKYLWWSQNNTTCIQLFDNCYLYPVLKSDSLKALDFYVRNKNKIDGEEIKPAENKKVISYRENGKKNNREEIISWAVSHSCHHMFKFIVDSVLIGKDCDDYNLQFTKFGGGLLNTNWKYNQGTKLKILIKLISEETEGLKTIFGNRRQ